MSGSEALARFVPGRPHWWQWCTVLALDAPLVVLAWQALLAREACAHLAWPHRSLLAGGVWLAYVADRWFEAVRLDPERIRTQRHWFCQRYRWPLAGLWLAVFVTLVAVASVGLDARAWFAGLLVLGPVAAYLLSHQGVHRQRAGRLPKELCVAALLTAGVGCFVIAGRPEAWLTTVAPLAGFAALCFTNCALISQWETEVDLSQGQTSLALTVPATRRIVPVLPWALAVVAGMATPWSISAACVGASAALLGFVDLLEPRIGRQLARALADLVLLTPFVALAASGAG